MVRRYNREVQTVECRASLLQWSIYCPMLRTTFTLAIRRSWFGKCGCFCWARWDHDSDLTLIESVFCATSQPSRILPQVPLTRAGLRFRIIVVWTGCLRRARSTRPTGSYDAIIIGGGTAGAIVAAKLRLAIGGSKRILVIEAGGPTSADIGGTAPVPWLPKDATISPSSMCRASTR